MPEELARGLKALAGRRSAYGTYRAYYDGQHRLAFATQKFANAFGSIFSAFADNLCEAVVDALADRLAVVGFSVEEGAAGPAQDAWAIWQANRMDRRAGDVHVEALRAGDAYVIVWPDEGGRPVLTAQPAELVTVAYDSETPERVQWAVKAWLDADQFARATVYYPDRIEKYRSRTKMQGGVPDSEHTFAPYAPPDDPRPVLPNPWEVVPVFHFANNAGLLDFGRSELANVLPLQNALNKAVTDMMVAMEFVALPQRWATGLEVDIDPVTGKPVQPFTPGADRVWSVGAPEVKFGQFDQANLEHFLSVQERFRAEIARVSGTPLHYLMLQGGDFPSGEAMKTAEARFLAKIKDRQLAFGNTWEDALGLALRMAGQADVRLSTLWNDPTPRSERDQADVAVIKRQLGVSSRQVLRELGYADDLIDKMAAEEPAEPEDDRTTENGRPLDRPERTPSGR